MVNIQDKLESLYPGYKLIYLTVTGSKLFGLDTPKSDTDYKGLYIPSIESFLLKEDVEEISMDTNPLEKNTSEDQDIKLYSVEKFLYLLTEKSDSNCYDILFSMFADKILLETEESNIIKENYKSLIAKKPEGFIGFAYKQASRYSVKGDRLNVLENIIAFIEKNKTSRKQKIGELFDLIKEEYKNNVFISFQNIKGEGEYISVLNRLKLENTTVDNYLSFLSALKNTFGARAIKAKEAGGVDYKAFSHALRAVVEVKELLTTGFITFPIKEEDRKFLKDIKLGVYSDLKELSNLMDNAVDEALLLKEKSSLQESVPFEVIRDLKRKLYKLN